MLLCDPCPGAPAGAPGVPGDPSWERRRRGHQPPAHATPAPLQGVSPWNEVKVEKVRVRRKAEFPDRAPPRNVRVPFRALQGKKVGTCPQRPALAATGQRTGQRGPTFPPQFRYLCLECSRPRQAGRGGPRAAGGWSCPWCWSAVHSGCQVRLSVWDRRPGWAAQSGKPCRVSWAPQPLPVTRALPWHKLSPATSAPGTQPPKGVSSAGLESPSPSKCTNFPRLSGLFLSWDYLRLCHRAPADVHGSRWDRRGPGSQPGSECGPRTQETEHVLAGQPGAHGRARSGPRQLPSSAPSWGPAPPARSLRVLPDEDREMRDNCRTERAAV